MSSSYATIEIALEKYSIEFEFARVFTQAQAKLPGARLVGDGEKRSVTRRHYRRQDLIRGGSPMPLHDSDFRDENAVPGPRDQIRHHRPTFGGQRRSRRDHPGPANSQQCESRPVLVV